MAIDLETTTDLAAAATPSGYTDPATTNVLTDPREEPFTHIVAASATAHASDAATGLTALVAAVDAWLESTFIPSTLGLESTVNTVTAIGTIKFIRRENSGYGIDADASGIHILGTDQFEVIGTLLWEIS